MISNDISNKRDKSDINSFAEKNIKSKSEPIWYNKKDKLLLIEELKNPDI